MRSLLGRFHRPNARSQPQQLFMLNSLGDGSTLSLDFTTGVLDPRITFTRSTNATFINSQGYVQFADANMFVNSAWTDANNTPTGWTLGSGTGSVSRSNETRTLTCAAQQYWWYQQPASRSGLTYSVSVEVTAVSGSMVYGDIILAGSSTYIAWYKNGVLQASGTSTTVTTGVITLIFTANSDNTILRLGLGSAGTNVTGSVTLRYPQFQLGQVPLRLYYENTSTSVARYDSGRFDYDPTTLAPQGLLVEGTATNLLNWSESFATSGGTNNNWADTSITRTTGQADPANGTTAIRFTASAGNATVISSAAIGTSAARTFSVWLRRVTGTGDIQYTQNNGTNWTTQAITSTWTRYNFTHTVDHRVGIRIVTSGNAIEMWGAMLETGSGASSYISTGASQATRNADNCELLDLSTMVFNASAGTIYTDVGTRLNTGSQRNYTFLPASGGNNQIFEGSGIAFNVFSSGAFVAQIGTSTLVAQKIAAAYALNDYAVSVAGGSVATDTSGALPTSLTKLTIGGSIINSAAYMGGCIRVFKYWPTRLPNAQLQALTT